MKMKRFLTILAFIFLFISNPVSAAELLMVHNPLCGYCILFMRKIKPTYDEMATGIKLPLKILDISEPKDRQWLRNQIKNRNIRNVRGTPTFILYVDGKEKGRIVGYPGKSNFYNALEDMIKSTSN